MQGLPFASALSADEVIARLGMAPHPEGGHFIEIWRGPRKAGETPGGRPHASLIYFLLREGEVSHWHTIDAAEIWLWHAGAPLALSIAPAAGGEPAVHELGGAAFAFQAIVPEGAWQSARSLGTWSLVSCVVAPAFHYEGFRMAPPGWHPSLG
ncbi:hypothetical protein SAMN05444156_1629 [Verrucomicrobium sp. GAS474]|uniref:cupin domain-containing protein n=1 Tax=Verrucomicrobium sp. GAS474 TaxID=1882831 RepID=UPI00087CE228|nr:cupin domain-containing protein [Verrucomicrobium sp. GAS474]SDU04371.1 hypothetical protein SAMN05444156_1629 [Verrucomicrobium sp. GAS474]